MSPFQRISALREWGQRLHAEAVAPLLDEVEARASMGGPPQVGPPKPKKREKRDLLTAPGGERSRLSGPAPPPGGPRPPHIRRALFQSHEAERRHDPWEDHEPSREVFEPEMTDTLLVRGLLEKEDFGKDQTVRSIIQ